MIDTHCHILPGLDDGARDMETALEMARIAYQDGIRAMIATPHVDAATCLPNPETIRARTAELNEALAREGIAMTIHAGAEHALSGDLVEQVRAGELLTMADRGTHLLVELPFGGYPSFVSEVFFSLQLAGVTPVLAHPERAAAGRTDPALIRGLAGRGALVQLNLDSLLGRDGRIVLMVATSLVRDGLAHMVASDAHDTRARPPRLSPARRALRRLGGDAAFRALTVTGPARLLGEPAAGA